MLTPYPGTPLFSEMEAQGRITTRDWDLYDTRHVVYEPRLLAPADLKAGYDWAYREFYRWSSIGRGALSHASMKHRLKHFAYSAGWKKFERLWGSVIRLKQLTQARPLLEAILAPVAETPDVAAEDGSLAPGLPADGSPRNPAGIRRSGPIAAP